MALPKPEETFTYSDYLTWPQEERWELIHGIPYNMSPAPSLHHQQISFELAGQIHAYLRGKSCQAFTAPFDVRFPGKDETIDTVVQPDISIICDKTKLDERGCLGPPDIIIEILSPHTASKDLKEKFVLYELQGVKEYWVVEPLDKVVFVFTRGADSLYGKPRIFSPPDKIASGVVKNLVIELESVFAGE
ncbi:MAG: Uma2 family endonuclease [Spirochaetales bacterium]|nr:Uma2 family endonuclease [Spirochaetales bacterium]